MKETVILSGKGGVGKSTLTAAIGTLLAEKYRLVFADTDVEAPNLHLVLGAESYETSEIKASEKAVINYNWCNGCMECLDACRFGSIIGEREPVIIPYSCEGCEACAITCPINAISIEPVVNGRLTLLQSGNSLLVSGELGIGESGSGRLVDVVKKRARQEAEKRGADLIITDGPPGIGCPAIAALKNADYVVLVTEPTPAALHDLQRVVEVVGHFRLPVGMVLNRSDLHEATRQRFLENIEEQGFELLAEIPYDPLLPKSLAEGQQVIMGYPDAPSAKAIMALREILVRRLGSLGSPLSSPQGRKDLRGEA